MTHRNRLPKDWLTRRLAAAKAEVATWSLERKIAYRVRLTSEEKREAMGVSVYVDAVIPPNEQYLRMLKVWETCSSAGVSMPPEVSRYFEDMLDNGKTPSEEGMELSLYSHKSLTGEIEYGDGAELDLSDLPPGTTKLKIYMR